MSDAAPLLVTGASGFLGRHLLESYGRTKQRLMALVRDPASWRAQQWTAAHENVELVEGSVTQLDPQHGGLPRLGGIFHLAALVRHSRRNTDEVYETNVEGTLRMVHLAAAHGCRLVVLSSTGTVGCSRDPDFLADEESPHCADAVAGWPYYRSKIALERQARALAEALGVELVIVRPPVLLGPGDHRLRSTGIVLKALRGKLPFLVRGGMHFTDVRDAAQAIANAMHHPEVRPVYHLDGTVCDIERFFAWIADLSGVPASPLRAAVPRRVAAGPRRRRDRRAAARRGPRRTPGPGGGGDGEPSLGRALSLRRRRSRLQVPGSARDPARHDRVAARESGSLTLSSRHARCARSSPGDSAAT